MASRKLITEIDKTLKKVTEGVEVFEGIFSKIEIATNQSQKEKLEADLKKEIKKLQRYRDQIKTWASSNEIKDKKSLQESRKLIETQMERFKAMEKELKTKAYSAAGLNAASKVDPEEIVREELRKWISDQTDTLETQIDTLEAEREGLLLKKSKKNDTAKQERLDKTKYWIDRHRYHQNRLEVVLRMIDNGNLIPEQVEGIKEDIQYYIEENQDPDFEENEYIYEDLNLEEADVYFGNDDDEASDKDEPKTPPKSNPESRKASLVTDDKIASPKRVTTPRKGSSASKPEKDTKPSSSKTVPAPAKVSASGPKVSETFDAPAPPPPVLKYAAAAAIAIPKPEQPPAEVLISPNNSITSATDSKARQSSERKGSVLSSGFMTEPHHHSNEALMLPLTPPELQDITQSMPASFNDMFSSLKSTEEKALRNDPSYANSMIDLSFLNMPDAADSAKLKTYFPNNPYPVPGYYPQIPVSVFTTTPAIFERFDTDTLFFIFYFRPGTYQQFLAARELKRQSWRFHKKYQTWFQRNEEPQIVNDIFEQGAYIYFDYEITWSQRKKREFRFEYKFLLDDD